MPSLLPSVLALLLSVPAAGQTQASDAGAPPSTPTGDGRDGLFSPSTELPTDGQLARRAGAWDESVRLEQAGHQGQARSLLGSAWGEQPSSYEVALRLGWLSLALGEGDRAAAAYTSAARLPGADGQALVGLSSAWTLTGYDAYGEGDYGLARQRWRDALRLNPDATDAHEGLVLARDKRFDPELWLAFVGTTGTGDSLIGGSALLQLPFQLADELVLRAAYRHLEASATAGSTTRGPGRSGPSRRVSEEELFAGLGVGLPWLWLDAWATVLLPHAEGAVGGELARLRLGRRWGVTVDQAALDRDDGWNVQLAPQAFVWPLDALGLAAGAHLTFAQGDPAVAATAGVSLVTAPVAIHLQGHYGAERWPVSLDGPTVITVDGDLTGGGRLTVMVPLTESWTLGLQGHLAQVEYDPGTGAYGSAAAGLRWSPLWWLDDDVTPPPSSTSARRSTTPP